MQLLCCQSQTLLLSRSSQITYYNLNHHNYFYFHSYFINLKFDIENKTKLDSIGKET